MGLFAIQNCGDIGDRARRSDEAGRERIAGSHRVGFRLAVLVEVDGDIGPAIGGIERRHHAGFHFRQHTGPACRQIGFAVAALAHPLHACANVRHAHGLSTVLDGLFLRERRCAFRTGENGEQGDQTCSDMPRERFRNVAGVRG